jgi:hypothetical protein
LAELALELAATAALPATVVDTINVDPPLVVVITDVDMAASLLRPIADAVVVSELGWTPPAPDSSDRWAVASADIVSGPFVVVLPSAAF